MNLKRIILSLFAFLLVMNSVLANGITYNQGAITELFFDGNGNWTLEFKLTHFHHYNDSAFYLYSMTDSARLITTPDTLGY